MVSATNARARSLHLFHGTQEILRCRVYVRSVTVSPQDRICSSASPSVSSARRVGVAAVLRTLGTLGRLEAEKVRITLTAPPLLMPVRNT